MHPIILFLTFIENATVVLPNSTIPAYLTVESHVAGVLNCALYVSCDGCLAFPNFTSFKLYAKGDSKTLVVKIRVGDKPARITARAICNNYTAVTERVLTPRSLGAWAELIAPSTLTCTPETKYQPYTFVVSSSMPAIVKFLTGRDVGHPDLIGLVCIKANGTYVAVLTMTTPDGRQIPISGQSMLLSPEAAQYGTIVVPVKGEVVVPIFVPGEAEKYAGVYNLSLYLYPPGSSTPVFNESYTIRVISVRGESVFWAFFSIVVAFPFFVFSVYQYVRKSGVKEIVLPLLFAPLSYVVSYIPGALMRGVGAFLGPFDWALYGFFYGTLLYFILAVLAALRPAFGAFSLYFLGVLILNVFFNGLSLIMFIWTTTSAFFFELLLYATGVTRGRPTFIRTTSALVAASVVDRYVDFIIYASLYRLFYADWYLASYIAGMTLYTLAGAAMGARTSGLFRTVYHE